MANKIIKYTLTNAERTGSKRNGKVPTFIEEGGWYPKANGNDPPADWDMIGVTVDGSSEEGLGVFANQAAIKTYLDTYTSDWKDQDTVGDSLSGAQVFTDFNQTAAAAFIWAKKID